MKPSSTRCATSSTSTKSTSTPSSSRCSTASAAISSASSPPRATASASTSPSAPSGTPTSCAASPNAPPTSSSSPKTSSRTRYGQSRVPLQASSPLQLFLFLLLDVKFQEVVVHSIENWEAEFAKQKRSQETEWTITIMLDWWFTVENNLRRVF